MAALTQEAVRQRVATALDGVTDWTESRWHPALFGQDTGELMRAKVVFAVEHIGLDPIPQTARRVTDGLPVYSRLRVHLMTPVTVDDQVTSADLSLTREHTAIKTVAAMSKTDIGAPQLESVSREPHSGGEAILAALIYRIPHVLALS